LQRPFRDARAACADGREARDGIYDAVVLVSHQVIVELIAATTTSAGLKVHCQLDPNTYPAGIKVSNAELQAVDLIRHDFHGEWNYTISPKVLALEQ
jgi:hypothetical protein